MKDVLHETIFSTDPGVRLFFRLWLIGSPLVLGLVIATLSVLTAPPY